VYERLALDGIISAVRRHLIKPEDQKKQAVPTDPAFYKDLLDHIGDGVYFVDRDRRIQYWNEGAHRLTGYTAEELLGKCCQDDHLCHVDQSGRRLCDDGCPLAESISDGKSHQVNVFLRHKQGRRVPVSSRVQPMRAADGSIIGAIEIFRDNSAELDAQRKTEAMNRLAFLDHLTELPNRRFLEMSLHTALSEFEVHKDPLGVIVIDIDKFKKINDKFGHSGGDRALQEAAKTLVGSLRPTDTIGRWGGDEFLAIARNVDRAMLGMLAERCVDLIAQTSVLSHDGRRMTLSSSVGAALSRPGESAEAFIHRADELMYRSKNGGRGRATTE
jgi:diguanylate cyclase (GGDEF)-like protein/PAS domain S-box-containing protein